MEHEQLPKLNADFEPYAILWTMVAAWEKQYPQWMFGTFRCVRFARVRLCVRL
jgi:hypothetical protein